MSSKDTGYNDSAGSPKERAQALLSELTIDEKMAQLTCIFPFGENYEDMERQAEAMPYGVGQVSTLEMRRMHTLEEAAAWQRKMQMTVMAQSPHHIPAIFHMEGLCGAFIQESASFPSGIARGSGWNPDLEEQIARTVAEQEAACGITHILAPVLDISRDSRMGRQGETYGEDPALAAALGVAYTRGVQTTQAGGRKPESVAKHFLGFHNSQGGIHGSQSDTPPRLMEEIYGKPFQAAIAESGLKGIMPCYNSIDGEPASVSRRILTELLRGRMGFDGLAVSDYGGISNAHEVQHIGETLGETGLLAMEAGMDMEMPTAAGYGEELKTMFGSGEADMELLDRTVLRVLEAKFRMGLFEHPFAMEGEELHQIFFKEKGAELSLRSARESMILLKNKGVLPMSAKLKKLAVIGPHADSARKFFGGYTHLCMMESVYAVKNSIAGVGESPESGKLSDAILPDGEPVTYVPGTQIQSDEAAFFDEILRRQKPECKSLLEELRMRLPETEIFHAYGYPVAGADDSGFEEALKAVREADAVILTLGGKHGTCSMATMGEGVDASEINLPKCQEAFIRAAAVYKKPLIGVHFDGRPISSDAADQYLDAIVEAWSPAESGAQAVTDVLLGAYNPGGKLPVSVAYHAGQIPVFYNHPNGSAWHQQESIGFVNYVDLPHRPRYCFGYGLSYTRFAYTDLEITDTEATPSEELQISCIVENTGGRAGDEVVQLYFADRFASMTRPVKELAGFRRIHLEPNEKVRVTFTVKPDQTAFLDREMRWKVEKGEVCVEIGSSSEDIRLKGTFRITEDQWIDGANRTFYAKTKTDRNGWNREDKDGQKSNCKKDSGGIYCTSEK